MLWNLSRMLTFLVSCVLLAGSSSASTHSPAPRQLAGTHLAEAAPYSLRAYAHAMSGYYSVGASPQLNSSGGYVSTVVAQLSSSCVDVNGGSAQVGLGIDEWSCTGTANQKFNVNPTTDGFFVIQSQINTLCLDAGSGSVTTGVQVVQKACSGGEPQKWKLVANAGGTYFITTPDGTGCLDIFGGRTANGTSVITWACHNSNNEAFLLPGLGTSAVVPPPTTVPPVQPPTSGGAPPPTIATGAPRIFNASQGNQPGDIAFSLGANFDGTSQVWLAGKYQDRRPNTLPITNRAGATWLAVQVPSSASGAITLWVTNSHGTSNSGSLNAAIPWHLDSLQLVPGGAFKIFGKNLLVTGYTPVVTVDGQAASVNVSQSQENMLVMSAPSTLRRPPHRSSWWITETGQVQFNWTVRYRWLQVPEIRSHWGWDGPRIHVLRTNSFRNDAL